MYKRIKNILDQFFALVAMIVLTPLFLLIIVLIKLDSRGPAVLKQQRVGYKQKLFFIYKFRTMKSVNIDFDPNNPVIKNNNANVTRIGKLLRKVKLDELPQLLNILRGEMSFIGIRPLMSSYLSVYEDWEFAKFDIKPGLSGYAQIKGNGHLTTVERSYYDILYGKKQSFTLDVKILIYTLFVVIKGEEKFLKTVSDTDMTTLINEVKHDSNGKIKIAQIVGNVSLGGVPNAVLNYCKHLDKNKFDIDFYTFGDGKINDEFAKLGRVYFLPSFINFPKTMMKLNKYFKRNPYHIVHSNLTALSVFPLFVAFRRGIKARICHAHSTTHKKDKKRLFKELLRPFSKLFATKYVACSEAAAKWFYRKDATKTLILNNAIDINKFSYSAFFKHFYRNELGIKPDEKVLGFVGRFAPQKNLSFLIDIMNVLKDKNYKLVLIGNGEEREALLNKIDGLQLNKNIIFIPPNEEIFSYYNVFDGFIMTSLFEGLPLVAIESLANGLPLILSDSITTELSYFKNVYYFSLNSPPSVWANAIETINLERVDHSSNLISFGFDINNETKKLDALYTVCFKDLAK